MDGPRLQDEWKAVWSVECSIFFFQREFFTPGQKPLCQGDCLISLLKGCQRWLRFESSFWCWRVKEAALPTISHCVSSEPQRHVSPTVEHRAIFPEEEQRRGWGRGGGWGAGSADERREERHRSNGHREVYHISIQPESEKLSQSQLGVFWRKKLTRGKNRINITALNQYIKPSNVLLRGCSRKLRTCSDSDSTWLCLQTVQVRGIQTVGMKGWHCSPYSRNQLGFA